jgi:hypothetical protein
VGLASHRGVSCCRDTRESIMRIAAAQYVAVMTLGFSNAATVQPIVFVERSVFYRWGHRNNRGTEIKGHTHTHTHTERDIQT